MTEGGEHELQASYCIVTKQGLATGRQSDVQLSLPPICPREVYAKELVTHRKPHPLKSAQLRKDKKIFQLT